jgi:hypothetical protein
MIARYVLNLALYFRRFSCCFVQTWTRWVKVSRKYFLKNGVVYDSATDASTLQEIVYAKIYCRIITFLAEGWLYKPKILPQ